MRLVQVLNEVEVISSWIAELEWDDDGVIMILNSGREYKVHDVDFETFEEWVKAPSKGKFWHSDIRDMYIVTRI